MTKLKSKKITKSTIAIIIMGIAIVALLAFGGTFAYFTAKTNSSSSDFSTGKVLLTATSSVTIAGENLVPGKTIAAAGYSNIVFGNQSTVETVVAVKYSITYTGYYYEAEPDGNSGYQWATDPTNDTISLTSAEITEAFGSSTLAINTTNWVDNNNGIYIYRTAADGVYKMSATGTTSSVAFVTSPSAIVLQEGLDRQYIDGELTKTPASDGARFLVWEGAEVTISAEAFQTQITYTSNSADATATYANAYAILQAIFGTTEFPN